MRRHPARFVGLSLVVLVVTAAAAARQAPVVTPALILDLVQAVDAQVSPDGAAVVYQVTRHRSAGDPPGPARQELWLVPSDGGDVRRLTAGEDRGARWSPDGNQIAFLGRRGDGALTQVHLIATAGGDPRALTSAPSNVSSFKWSPDGRHVAYTYVDPKTEQEKKDEAAGRDWTVVDRNYKHTKLYRIEVATGRSELVTMAQMTVIDYDWSPDGSQFVVGAAPTPTIDDSFMGVRLFIVPATGGVPEPFVNTVGKLTTPRWSPDGRWIAWLGATSVDDPYAGSVFVAPSRASDRDGRDRRNLSGRFEGTATWLGWDPGRPDVVTFTTAERQDTRLYRQPAGSGSPLAIGTSSLILFGAPSFSADGSRVAFVANSPAHPNEVFVSDGAGAPRRLTRLNPQLDGVALGAQEVIAWKAKDGWTIEGVLVKPVGYEAGRRYPLIVQPHGGPESADPNGWYGTYSRWGQMLAGAGYAVLYPNYRGSIGRGVEFAKADHRDLMGAEFQDILAGIDHLVATGVADPDRVGIGGGSYGGYTSAWAATYASPRFKAAVPWMGISNWISMTGTSDIFFENSTVHWALVMYENYEKYWERSPLRHIDNALTPALIVHGAVDPRVPIGQSQELYTALKWKGVPVEFVIYPREGHGIAERAHQEDFMARVLAFFNRYVRG